MLDTCQRNVQEMSELLNDLKDYSVLIAGAASLQIEEINIRVFGSELEASFHAITHAAGMRLDLQIDPDLNVVRSDRRKIRQIITNLVTNAINYCRRDKPNTTVVLAFRSLDQSSWQIAVEDSGIGNGNPTRLPIDSSRDLGEAGTSVPAFVTLRSLDQSLHAQPHVGVDIIRGLRDGLRAHPLALIRGQNCLVLRRVGFIHPKRIQVKSLKPDLALASPGGRFLSQVPSGRLLGTPP